jgi:hypothetical protein
MAQTAVTAVRSAWLPTQTSQHFSNTTSAQTNQVATALTALETSETELTVKT